MVHFLQGTNKLQTPKAQRHGSLTPELQGSGGFLYATANPPLHSPRCHFCLQVQHVGPTQAAVKRIEGFRRNTPTAKPSYETRRQQELWYCLANLPKCPCEMTAAGTRCTCCWPCENERTRLIIIKTDGGAGVAAVALYRNADTWPQRVYGRHEKCSQQRGNSRNTKTDEGEQGKKLQEKQNASGGGGIRPS